MVLDPYDDVLIPCCRIKTKGGHVTNIINNDLNCHQTSARAVIIRSSILLGPKPNIDSGVIILKRIPIIIGIKI